MQRRNMRRRDQAFRDLDERLQRVLFYLSRVLVLQREAIRFVAWPEGVSDQTFSSALTRWADDKFIDPYDNARAWQLFVPGNLGYRRLREAGFDLPTERTRPAASAIEGLTIASDFAVTMMREALREQRVLASAWSCNPFQGPAPRPDATGYLIYDLDFPRAVVEDTTFLGMTATTPIRVKQGCG